MKNWAAREQYDELALSVAGRWLRDTVHISSSVSRQRVADAFMGCWTRGKIGIQVQVQGNFTIVLIVSFHGSGVVVGVGASKRRPRGWAAPDFGELRAAVQDVAALLRAIHKAVAARDLAMADELLVAARWKAQDGWLRVFSGRDRVGDPPDGDVGVRAALPHAIRAALDGWRTWLEVPAEAGKEDAAEDLGELLVSGDRVIHGDPVVYTEMAPGSWGHRIADPCAADADSSVAQVNTGNPGAGSEVPF